MLAARPLLNQEPQIMWHPIDTAPDDGTCFMAVDGFNNQWICHRDRERGVRGIGHAVCAIAREVAEHATHWQPLQPGPHTKPTY